VEPNRKQAVIAIVAAILAARKLSTVYQRFRRTVLLASLQSPTLLLIPGESLTE
jgi:hypothetical protein